MVVPRGDAGVLGRHQVERPLPEIARIGEHVGLVHERHVVACAALGEPERVPDTALDTVAGVDRPLRGDLERRSAPERTAFACIRALGVLAHHDEVGAGGD